jgi:hypothetical protein
MVSLRSAYVLLILIGILPATAKDNKAWLDGEVTAVGHVAGNNGHQVQTATVVLYDPGNSNPLARKQVWVITAEAYLAGKTMVPLSVGTPIKAYQTGETSLIYGYIVIRYLDKKGREKGDFHLIVDALSPEEIAY